MKVEPTAPTTPAELDTSSGFGKDKLHPGSSGIKSALPKQVADYWEDPLRKKEDAEAQKWEEDRHQKKPSGPILSLDEHEYLIGVLTSRAMPSQSSEPSSLPAHTSSEGKRDQGKIRLASPALPDSSDYELLSNNGGKPPESNNRRRNFTTPELVIVDEDIDSPLPDKPKGSGKKPHIYTQQEINAFDTLCFHLKSEACTNQYSLETAGLTHYHNTHVPGF